MALSCGKKRSTLFRRIMSKYHGKLYCLNCLNSFETNGKVYKNKYCCGILINL